MDPNEIKEKILKKVVDEKELDDKVILDRETYAYKDYNGQMHVIDDPKVEEWLALIRESDLFLTDSFHGVCFALIFHKEFYVLFERTNWRGIERISEFLDAIGLSDRLIVLGEEAQTTLTNPPINYNRVKEILVKKVSKSKEWLNENLRIAEFYKGISDDYDIFLDDNSYNSALNAELKKQLCMMKADLFFLKHQENNIPERTLLSMKNSRIIGFGVGNCLGRNIDTVLQTCKIAYLVDNDPDKWGKEYYGIKCISPSKIAAFGDAFVIIFIDDVGISFNILRQLNSMGVYAVDHVNNYLNEVVVEN